jgi:carbohydrate kinase (thermoresistant glucokinase family)
MIVVVAGVSGSGKTTVGNLLASRLGWPFEDGDALHPPANVAKMHAGIPLTDEDRKPWLAAIAGWIDRRIAAGGSAVVGCSALKRSYREFLLTGGPSVRLVLLHADPGVLAGRLRKRHGHFFPAQLLESQLADLELPGPGEPGSIVVTATGDPATVAEEIIQRLGLAASTREAQR